MELFGKLVENLFNLYGVKNWGRVFRVLGFCYILFWMV